MENKVYISDDYLNNIIRARKFELEGKWLEARQLWQAEKMQDHVDAIDLIIESTRKGDLYRSMTADAFQRYEERKLNMYELDTILRDAHKEVYGKA